MNEGVFCDGTGVSVTTRHKNCDMRPLASERLPIVNQDSRSSSSVCLYAPCCKMEIVERLPQQIKE